MIPMATTRRLGALLLIVSGAALVVARAGASEPASSATVRSGPGETAPLALGSESPLRDVPMLSVDGARTTIREAAGPRGTLVLFLCNHCPWVKAWQGRIASIGNAAVASGVGVIAVNSNDPADDPEDGFDEMVTRARGLGLKFPYAVDSTSDVARAFGATRTPEAFLFDAKGRLVYHGAVDDNAREEKAVRKTWLRDAVEAVARGRAVSVGETKALGCSIKYRS